MVWMIEGESMDDICNALLGYALKRVVLGAHDYPESHKRLYPGDVLSVSRWGNLYEHFAVYIGKGLVVHYASDDGDWGGDVRVRKAALDDFVADSDGYRICRFPKSMPIAGYHLYSHKETVERALSRLGETDYSLFSNNCEHFAIWCRTGLSMSKQVEEFLREIVRDIPMA